MNYDTFEYIKLKDIDLIRCNKCDCVYNRLTKNGITNLKDIFELDDLDLIKYGNLKSLLELNKQYLTRGVVKLLRAKYLNEPIPNINILDGYYNKGTIIIDGMLKDEIEFVQTFMKLGLTFNFVVSFRRNIKCTNIKIIDLFRIMYFDELLGCLNKEYKQNKERLKIIIDNYEKYILKETEIIKLTKKR